MPRGFQAERPDAGRPGRGRRPARGGGQLECLDQPGPQRDGGDRGDPPGDVLVAGVRAAGAGRTGRLREDQHEVARAGPGTDPACSSAPSGPPGRDVIHTGEQPQRDRGRALRGRVIEGLFRSGDGDEGRSVWCRTARAGLGWLQPARAGVQLPALGNCRTWPYECAGKDRLPSLLDPPGYQLRVRPGIPPLPPWRPRQRSSIRSIIRARQACPDRCLVPVAVLVPALDRAGRTWPRTAAS